MLNMRIMLTSQKSKINVLKFTVIILLIAGVVFSCVPFAGSLKPPLSALEKWQVEIDISNLSVGELKEYSGKYNSIWVYHRTRQQILWLDSYTPTNPDQYVLDHARSMVFGGKYRSINKKYFVFRGRTTSGKTYLQQERAWNHCGKIKYFPGLKNVKDQRTYNGVIACSKDFNSLAFDGWGHIYDVAGVAASEFIAPLEVPYYEFNYKGNILVGPKPL